MGVVTEAGEYDSLNSSGLEKISDEKSKRLRMDSFSTALKQAEPLFQGEEENNYDEHSFIIEQECDGVTKYCPNDEHKVNIDHKTINDVANMEEGKVEEDDKEENNA